MTNCVVDLGPTPAESFFVMKLADRLATFVQQKSVLVPVGKLEYWLAEFGPFVLHVHETWVTWNWRVERRDDQVSIAGGDVNNRELAMRVAVGAAFALEEVAQ
jgi:hypothetical protein